MPPKVRQGDPSPPGGFNLLQKGLGYPVRRESETHGVMIWFTLQAVLSSNRVPHMWRDEKPVNLPALLSFGIRRGWQVRRRWSNYRITPCKGDREFVWFEVPVTTYNIGVVTE
eukprot:3747010-Amphidinium_carterae.3